MKSQRRVVAVAVMAATIIAILLVNAVPDARAAVVLRDAGVGFDGGGGAATKDTLPGAPVNDPPTPGCGFGLVLPTDAAFAGIDYLKVDPNNPPNICSGCSAGVGLAPTTGPSFWFRSSVTSAASGGAPRLVMRFSGTNSSMQLRPLSWVAGTWTFVDGAASTLWDSNAPGPGCTFQYGVTYADALACHGGEALIETFIVTDTFLGLTPFTHFIDDVTIFDAVGGPGGSTFFSEGPCPIDAALTDFRDKRRGNDITVGLDLREGQPLFASHFQAINFTGSAGSGGDTWVTVYDETPADGTVKNTFTGSVSLSASVLIVKPNNAKGPGLLALYNQPPPPTTSTSTTHGLALFLLENGNSDRLVLARVTGTPTPPNTASAPTTLATKALGSGILINKWYCLTMDVVVTGPNFSVTGKVFRHVDPLDPTSACGQQVDGDLTFPSTGTASLALVGLANSGEVGIAATVWGGAVNSSVTNFEINP